MALNTIHLPTNGALMTPEQADALEAYVRSTGTPTERAMLHQMQIMVHGATAHKLLLENERTCRMTAERQARDLQLEVSRLERAKSRTEEAEASEAALLVTIQKMQTALQALPKKPRLADYAGMVKLLNEEIEKALKEEINETSEGGSLDT
jgi:hypothetical protein